MVTALVVGLGTDSVAPDESLSAVDPAVVGPPLLIGIVLVKFGFDLAGRYGDRLVALDEDTTVELGWAYDPPAADPIDPVASVERRPRPTVAGRLLGGLSTAHVTRHPGALIPGGLLAVASLLFAIGGVWEFVVAGVVVSAGLLAIDWWVRYGGLEYRVSGEAVVRDDCLFRTRVWRIEPWDERGPRVEGGRLRRWLGTTTVLVDGPDRERRHPHLREPDAILGVFDRRADSLSLDHAAVSRRPRGATHPCGCRGVDQRRQRRSEPLARRSGTERGECVYSHPRAGGVDNRDRYTGYRADWRGIPSRVQ
jgi:hypothetical protein